MEGSSRDRVLKLRGSIRRHPGAGRVEGGRGWRKEGGSNRIELNLLGFC